MMKAKKLSDQKEPLPLVDCDIATSAARFERIRRAHQKEVAEDYVEMIAELITRFGEARTGDLAARFGVSAPR